MPTAEARPEEPAPITIEEAGHQMWGLIMDAHHSLKTPWPDEIIFHGAKPSLGKIMVIGSPLTTGDNPAIFIIDTDVYKCPIRPFFPRTFTATHITEAEEAAAYTPNADNLQKLSPEEYLQHGPKILAKIAQQAQREKDDADRNAEHRQEALANISDIAKQVDQLSASQTD